MRHALSTIIELPHRIMCRLSPTYNANAGARDMRARGYDVRPGDYLGGVKVTR